MRGFIEDVRHAWRIYRRTPAAAVFAIVALGIGMANVTAAFSLYNDLAVRPPPGFTENARLVTIGATDGQTFDQLSLGMLDRLPSLTSSVVALTGVHERNLTWRNGESTRDVKVELVTLGYSRDLSPPLRLGNDFTSRDHLAAAPPVAVVSYRFWQARLAGSPDVIGTTLSLSGGPEGVAIRPDGTLAEAVEHSAQYRIVGVYGKAQSGTFADDTDVWLPYEQAAPLFIVASDLLQKSRSLFVLARLRPGVTITSLRRELASRYRPEEDPSAYVPPTSRLDVLEGVARDIGKQREARRQVVLLLCACFLLVLVAAGNISLFLFSQAPRRRRELAIRMAVGAPFGRITRQLVTEAAVIVVSAAILGMIGSLWMTLFLKGLPMLRGAQWRAVSIFDWRVLLVVLGATLILTMVVSLSPVLGIRRLGLSATSRQSSARPGLAQHVAETVQIAVATVLAGVAVAFVWYLLVLDGTNRGFKGADVYLIESNPPDPAKIFTAKQEEVTAQRARIRQVVSGLPAVQRVTFSGSVPGMVTPYTAQIDSGLSPAGKSVSVNVVSADTGYFDMLALKLVRGRKVQPGEPGAVVVNETLARRVWGQTDVVGKVFKLYRDQVQVVGVVSDAVYGHPAEQALAMVFMPYTRISYRDHLMVQSTASAEELRAQLQAKIAQGQLDMSILSIHRVDDVWQEVLAPDRARTTLTSALAGIVVLLAAFGFYGTQRFMVSAGKREFAIRRAIGANPRATQRLVICRGLLLALPGLLLGLALSYSSLAWMRGELISTAVPIARVIGLVTVLVALLLGAATTGPAREASISPMAATLRDE